MAELHCAEGHQLLHIKELIDLRNQCTSDEDCAQRLMKYDAYSDSPCDSLRAKLRYSYAKWKRMKTNKSKQLDEYLSSEFMPVITREERMVERMDESKKELTRKILTETKNVVEESRQLKRDYQVLADENNYLEQNVEQLANKLNHAVKMLSFKSHDYVKVIEDQRKDKDALTKELKKCDEQHKRQTETILMLSSEVQSAEEKISKFNTRNVNKKLKRRDANIEKLKTDVAQLRKENSELQKEGEEKTVSFENECLENKTMKKQKHQLQKDQFKLRTKIDHLKQECSNAKEEKENVEFLLTKQVRLKETQISELQSCIDLMESDTVTTFENGRYTNEVRACCMGLITEGCVSLNKLPGVIETVLQSFTGKTPQRLPSKTLLSWLMAEAKVVASRQVVTAMIDSLDQSDTTTGNVLHQDAGTKFHLHYEGAQVTLTDGKSYTIGLKEVAGGDGQT